MEDAVRTHIFFGSRARNLVLLLLETLEFGLLDGSELWGGV